VLFAIAGFILAWGVSSEIIAVAALYQQRDSTGGFIVLSGAILMVIAAAGPPALVFARYAWAPVRALRVLRTRERAGYATGPGSQEPGATTPPEAGETGTEG
jgi:hypothetical protein